MVGEHPFPVSLRCLHNSPANFCLRAIVASILVNDRLLLEQIAVEVQAFLDLSRSCFMGFGMQDQKGLVPPGLARFGFDERSWCDLHAASLNLSDFTAQF